MNIKNIFDYSENKNSLGNRFRAKRFHFFLEKLNKLEKPIKILDIGGKINFWENRNLAGISDFKITIVNIKNLISLNITFCLVYQHQ